MTRQGYDHLKDELERLKRVERPAITRAIAEARAHGDLSENAEYHAAREKQGFTEARIKELEAKVATAEVIDPPTSGDRVTFGSTVRVEDDDGKERFGLVVDAVGGVVTVNRRMLEANPCTLEAKCKWLFDGAYKMPSGLLVQLDPQKLRPSRLAETAMFRQGTMGENA